MTENNKIGFFEATPGNKSIMRLGFAFILLNAAGMGWYLLLTGNPTYAAAVITANGAIATGMKLVQKGMEKKKEDAN